METLTTAAGLQLARGPEDRALRPGAWAEVRDSRASWTGSAFVKLPSAQQVAQLGAVARPHAVAVHQEPWLLEL